MWANEYINVVVKMREKIHYWLYSLNSLINKSKGFTSFNYQKNSQTETSALAVNLTKSHQTPVLFVSRFHLVRVGLL